VRVVAQRERAHRARNDIVGRSKRFWLLVDESLGRRIGARVGDVVKVAVRPGKPDPLRTAYR